MRFGVLGTGEVGRTIAGRLVDSGHEVVLGSRTPDNPAAAAWAAAAGDRAGHGTFAAAAEAGEVLFNCTPGTVSLDVLATIPGAALAGKILVDVANPLDHSGGFPPTLAVCNTTSLGEQIQAAHPDLRVVKALNTMHNSIMVDPARLGGEHHVFVCSDDADAKARVVSLLGEWGWPAEAVIDLGGIDNARGTEMVLPLWVRLYATLGAPDFNLAVVR